jgi:REP element-mobilizing transposase RayT
MKRAHHERTSWHVILRGARRLILFRDDADRAAFLGILARQLDAASVDLHAFVLMDNHYHLLATADWKQLGTAMQQTNRLYSRGNNRKYGLQGHAFEGPYLAFPRRGAFWMRHTARYIDFNPVRAGLVSRPELYRWSSCRHYATGAASPIPLQSALVLRAFDGDRAAYRSFEPPCRARKSPAHITAMDLWCDQALWLLRRAEERAAELMGESPKTVAAAWARRAGVPPRAIARALGYADGHSVSAMLDQVRRRAESRKGLTRLLAPSELQ